MRIFSFVISLFFLFLITNTSHAYNYVASSKKSGYFEVGFGATQFDLAQNQLTDYDIAPSPSMKVLFGGKIGRSQLAWFELSYAYNGAFQTQDSSNVDDEVTTYRSQSIALGFKLTTAPHKKASAYFRAGGGRSMFETREESFTRNTSNLISSEYDTYLNNHYYAGVGINFGLNRKARIGIEAQQMQYKIEETSFADNTVMMTFTRYFK